MADVTFYCLANNYFGVPRIVTSNTGYPLSATFVIPDNALTIVTSATGRYIQSALADASPAIIVTKVGGDAMVNSEQSNWVGWSKIGEASFVLDLVNDAGNAPMVWPGFVYQIKKLGQNAIVYGSGGVTLMKPVSSPFATFGFKEISSLGVKNKTAVAGDEFVHFYIDRIGMLHRLTNEGSEPLGYEEFLSTLVNPVLVWDAYDRRLYISSATVGYVYNSSALTGGFASLSGLYRLNTSINVIGPDVVTVDPVSICTDTIDFKYRGLKSIEAIQFDVESSGALYAAIDYRYKRGEAFKTTRWTKLNSNGVAHIRTTGIEFRIRLKSIVRLNFELSYISIQYKLIDRRFSRGPIGETPEAYVN